MTAAVFYATREGHTRRIAERIAADLRERGAVVDVFDVRTATAPDWTKYSVACLAASVHVGHHEREMIEFARRHRDALAQIGGDALCNPAGMPLSSRVEHRRRHAGTNRKARASRGTA